MRRVRSIITGLIILFLASSLTKNVLDYRNTLSFYDTFQKEYEETKKQNIELQTRILKSTDDHELEKTIRNKLNLQKPGETTIIIAAPTPTPTIPTPTVVPTYRQWADVYIHGKM